MQIRIVKSEVLLETAPKRETINCESKTRELPAMRTAPANREFIAATQEVTFVNWAAQIARKEVGFGCEPKSSARDIFKRPNEMQASLLPSLTDPGNTVAQQRQRRAGRRFLFQHAFGVLLFFRNRSVSDCIDIHF